MSEKNWAETFRPATTEKTPVGVKLESGVFLSLGDTTEQLVAKHTPEQLAEALKLLAKDIAKPTQSTGRY